MQILLGLVFILNLFIFPISYVFRKSIVKKPNLWKWLLLYWFSDDSETWGNSEQNYINNWYGVYEILKKENGDPDYLRYKNMNWFDKFLLSYKWAALRNPNWNFQMLFNPKEGDKHRIKIIKVKGIDQNPLRWRNKTIHGIQSVTFYIGNTKYFRYSFTNYNNVIGAYINFMAGASDNRFILKLRVFK
tara:strand:- start:31 stop:594 length:564 start_codon:yes stop_codon:yes gene_type:complete